VFPVRYELNFYMKLWGNSACKGLTTSKRGKLYKWCSLAPAIRHQPSYNSSSSCFLILVLSLLPLLLLCSHNIQTLHLNILYPASLSPPLPRSCQLIPLMQKCEIWCDVTRSFTPAWCSSSKWHPTCCRFTGLLWRRECVRRWGD
jgi:hypothetical protein